MLANLNDILPKAQKERYAVGLFNTTDTDMLQAAIEAAEEMNSPIIIGTAEVLLPYGELELLAPAMVAAAARARVPVVVHYDHGLTFERCMEALHLGFTSIMFDGSAGDGAQNLEQTAQIVRIAHAMGASVEGEIGHVGQAQSDDGTDSEMYTTVSEAYDFAKATGVDALAIAIGTAHGVYKTKPRLDLIRLQEIRAAVETPLVLHGGSGLSEHDFRNAIYCGIAKINIFTDLCIAGMESMQQSAALRHDYLTARNEKVNAIRKAVRDKIALFGSADKG